MRTSQSKKANLFFSYPPSYILSQVPGELEVLISELWLGNGASFGHYSNVLFIKLEKAAVS